MKELSHSLYYAAKIVLKIIFDQNSGKVYCDRKLVLLKKLLVLVFREILRLLRDFRTTFLQKNYG